MLKILHKDYKDKVKRLLSVMLPIIGTQIAIMGMNFFDASMSGQAGDADLAGAAIGGNIWMPVQTCFAGILLAAMPLIANLLGAGEKEKIVFMHYPPICDRFRENEFTRLFEKYNVGLCIYGHLHAKSASSALTGDIDGVKYLLVSCDYLGFMPVKLFD